MMSVIHLGLPVFAELVQHHFDEISPQPQRRAAVMAMTYGFDMSGAPR